MKKAKPSRRRAAHHVEDVVRADGIRLLEQEQVSIVISNIPRLQKSSTHNDVPLLADPAIRVRTIKEGEELGVLVDLRTLDHDAVGGLSRV
jgi:hypothetical protein